MMAETDKADASLAGRTGQISNATVFAEMAGTGLLTFLIVAAGIFAERYMLQNATFTLLITAATGACGFLALSYIFARETRCYFTPALAFVFVLDGSLPLVAGLICASSHILAAMAGVMAAHLVTNTGLIQTAGLAQSGLAVWFGEALATASFVFAGFAALSHSRKFMPLTGAVSLLVIAFSTPSISFANPALTLARSLTDSFTAIALVDGGMIAVIQLSAAAGGWAFYRWLNRGNRK